MTKERLEARCQMLEAENRKLKEVIWEASKGYMDPDLRRKIERLITDYEAEQAEGLKALEGE